MSAYTELTGMTSLGETSLAHMASVSLTHDMQ